MDTQLATTPEETLDLLFKEKADRKAQLIAANDNNRDDAMHEYLLAAHEYEAFRIKCAVKKPQGVQPLRHEEYMKQANRQSDVDMVNSPPHYCQDGDIECIDAIRAALGKEGFAAFCRGNAIKYNWRMSHKNGLEDIAKARWYMNKLLEEGHLDT